MLEALSVVKLSARISAKLTYAYCDSHATIRALTSVALFGGSCFWAGVSVSDLFCRLMVLFHLAGRNAGRDTSGPHPLSRRIVHAV